jgi:hypothetical protein
MRFATTRNLKCGGYEFIMKWQAQRSEFARRSLAIAILCLSLSWILSSVFFPNGVGALAHHGLNGDTYFTAEFCDQQSQDDNKAPGPHPHHHRGCELCVACDHGWSLDRTVLVKSDIPFVSPRLNSARTWPAFVEPTAMPNGWASSWSSRAPPFFS